MNEVSGPGADMKTMLALIAGVPEDSFECYAYVLATRRGTPEVPGILYGTNAVTREDLRAVLVRALQVLATETEPWPDNPPPEGASS